MQQNILVKQEKNLTAAQKKKTGPEQEKTAGPENYQGETIQVFVFFRGEYLGCQCFAQKLVTIGGDPKDDLSLPAHQEKDSLSFSVSGGKIRMWYQNVEKDSGNGHDKESQDVEPLDSFLLGEYRFQVKLLHAHGLQSHRQDIEQGTDKSITGADFGSEQFNETMTVLKKRKEEEKEKKEKAAARVETLVDLAAKETKKATACEDKTGAGKEKIAPDDIEPAASFDQESHRILVRSDEQKEINEIEEINKQEAIEDTIEMVLQENIEREEVTEPQEAPEPQEVTESSEATEMIDENAAGERGEADEGFDLLDENFSIDRAEEEDDEEATIQYFSLLKQIFPDKNVIPQGLHKGQRAVEIVRFQAGDVQDISYLEENGDYSIRQGWSRSMWKRQGGLPPNFKMVRMNKDGVAELHLAEELSGRLYYAQESSQDIKKSQGRGNEKGDGLKSKLGRGMNNPFKVSLAADSWAVLRTDSYRYLVRYVPKRPAPPVTSMRPSLNIGQLKLLSSSLITHIVFILVITFAVPDKALEGFSREAQFARVDPELLKVLKPPPAIKKALKKPKPVPPRKSVAKAAPTKRRASRGKKKSPGGGGKSQQKSRKPVDVSQTGLLGALGGSGAGLASTKGQSEILLAAVTNLDAVAVPKGTATFNLAGIAGKLASSEIQVPSGDVIETMGATSILKAGNGMLGAMAGSGGDGDVKGIVHETPKAKISVRGGMSREAVLKVVTAHLDEVRDCYERELLHNPGLSGKILMEWLIKKNGKVRYAKIKFTNIGHSSDIHNCIQAQIVTWKFPKPTSGQEVLVTFPFMFENVGF